MGNSSYPVASGLGDVFTNFLGGETQRSDLGGKSGRGTDLTSGSTEVAVFIMLVLSATLIALDIVAGEPGSCYRRRMVNGSRT